MIHLDESISPKQQLQKLWLYYRYSNKDQTNLFSDTLISYKYDTSNPTELSKNISRIQDSLEDYFLTYYETVDLEITVEGSQMTLQLRVKDKDRYYDLFEVSKI